MRRLWVAAVLALALLSVPAAAEESGCLTREYIVGHVGEHDMKIAADLHGIEAVDFVSAFGHPSVLYDEALVLTEDGAPSAAILLLKNDCVVAKGLAPVEQVTAELERRKAND